MLIAVSVFSGCNNGKKSASEPESSTPDSETSSTAEEKPASAEKYSTTFMDYFDTVTVLIGYSETREEFDKWAEVCSTELKKYHELYDIYNDYEGVNNVKTINDNAGKEPVKVDDALMDLIEFGINEYKDTNGITNMAMGSVLKIWHDYREEALDNPENAKVPPMDELEKAAEHMNIENVVIDKEAGTVFLTDPEMSLDVGSLGKGYAVEKVCETLESQGVDHYLLNAGGNVRAIGVKADGSLWATGIENPYGEEELLGIVGLDGGALVTSGNYQRFYEIDGYRYHHIIDPYTLMPKNHISSVTVLCDDSGLADALSTALFNMSVEDGLKWVEARGDIEAMWTMPDKTRVYSQGFEEHMIDA